MRSLLQCVFAAADMSTLRLVSIVHPARIEPVPERRLELLVDVEATILAAHCVSGRTSSSTVRRISVSTRGDGRNARFPALASALALLDPAIVHLQAEPDTALARQVARLAAGQHRFGLVMETEADACGGREWSVMSALRSRRVLAGTGAVVARTAGALTRMRRLGFQGVGIVAASGVARETLPAAKEARRLLQLGPEFPLVLGWAGPADMGSGILDVLEAMAACEPAVALVLVASGRARQDITDRADALEILDRIAFVAPHSDRGGRRPAPCLAEQPAMAGAISALVLGPPRDRSERIAAIKNIEFAQVHSVPIIYPHDAEFAEIVGPGGWAVPACDPGLLARLLTTLCRLPAVVRDGSAAASSHAASRHSPEAAAADLDRAIHTVAAGRGGQRAAETHGGMGTVRLSFGREPSRT